MYQFFLKQNIYHLWFFQQSSEKLPGERKESPSPGETADINSKHGNLTYNDNVKTSFNKLPLEGPSHGLNDGIERKACLDNDITSIYPVKLSTDTLSATFFRTGSTELQNTKMKFANCLGIKETSLEVRNELIKMEDLKDSTKGDASLSSADS